MPRLMQIAQLGHPVLRQIAEPVADIDDSVQQLIDDLFATSDEANGAGIAAPKFIFHHVSSSSALNPRPGIPMRLRWHPPQ